MVIYLLPDRKVIDKHILFITSDKRKIFLHWSASGSKMQQKPTAASTLSSNKTKNWDKGDIFQQEWKFQVAQYTRR